MATANKVRIISLLLLGCLLPALSAMADIVVIGNRTERAIGFSLVVAAGVESQHVSQPGASLAVPTVRGPIIAFRSGKKPLRFQLEANRAYAFDLTTNQQVELRKIDLAGDAVSAQGTGVAGDRPATGMHTLAVRVYVDDEEPAPPEQWQQRLRRRVAEASKILERECRVRLEVTSLGAWNSSDTAADFDASWDEFEQEVPRSKGQLALGFSSQYAAEQGATEQPEHGVRRGLLRHHILIREGGARLSEAEKLEVLVQALGHFLGAFQSDHEDSVMRPLAGDGKARRASFRIGFDPANALAANLVAEELRVRQVSSAEELTTSTRLRLRQIYTKIPQPVQPQVAALDPATLPDGRLPGGATPRPDGGAAPADGDGPTDDGPAELDPRLDKRVLHIERDRKLLQGRWEVESAQLSGRPTRKLTGNEAHFEGDRLTVDLPHFGTLRFQFELTAGPVANQMTVTQLSQPGKAPGGLAILNQFKSALSQQSRYTLDGDTLKTSFVIRGFPLPPDIKKQLGDGRVQIVLKRVSPQGE